MRGHAVVDVCPRAVPPCARTTPFAVVVADKPYTLTTRNPKCRPRTRYFTGPHVLPKLYVFRRAHQPRRAEFSFLRYVLHSKNARHRPLRYCSRRDGDAGFFFLLFPNVYSFLRVFTTVTLYIK